jgi:hypothetical protein
VNRNVTAVFRVAADIAPAPGSSTVAPRSAVADYHAGASIGAAADILMRAGDVCHSEAFDAEESSSAKTLRYAQGDRL